MIRINLLPHREERRVERRRQFYVVGALSICLGLLIGYLVHSLIVADIEKQEQRNAFLQSEIKKLDEQIAEIKTLREQIDSLLKRKQIIESLQGSRTESVHLLNELAQRMPEGVYLKSAKQVGGKITLNGYAQTNSRVSHLMRRLDDSEFLAQPGLVEVKAVEVGGRRLSEFTLNINLVRPVVEDGDGVGGKR